MFVENVIMAVSALLTLLLLVFAVDWRYFRDCVVVFLFKSLLDLIAGSIVVEANLIAYPVRLFPQYYDTPLLFELWVFPTLCVLYNQITRNSGLWPIIYYAFLFSAGITLYEYPIEVYTDLLEYIKWSWVTTFISLTITFLVSRIFIAFFRWGCSRF